MARLLSVARRRTFSRGEVVFHAGDPADTLHLVSKGRFSVRITTPLGDSAILTILGPGDCFGELAVLEEEARRSATVAALEAGETHSLHQRDLDELRRRHPSTDEVLLRLVSAQVRRLTNRLVEALYVPADARVRQRLAELAGAYASPDPAATAEIALTQEELAGLAGTSRATVNRVLREESERGRVRHGRGRVAVIDPEGLEASVRRFTQSP